MRIKSSSAGVQADVHDPGGLERQTMERRAWVNVPNDLHEAKPSAICHPRYEYDLFTPNHVNLIAS